MHMKVGGKASFARKVGKSCLWCLATTSSRRASVYGHTKVALANAKHGNNNEWKGGST